MRQTIAFGKAGKLFKKGLSFEGIYP